MGKMGKWILLLEIGCVHVLWHAYYIVVCPIKTGVNQTALQLIITNGQIGKQAVTNHLCFEVSLMYAA
jgi:hypothetical protein